ncbi:hypothetical protein D3C78_1196630 [compost metagenome]
MRQFIKAGGIEIQRADLKFPATGVRKRGVLDAGDFAIFDQIAEFGNHNVVTAEAWALLERNACPDGQPNPGKRRYPLGERHQQRQRQKYDQ